MTKDNLSSIELKDRTVYVSAVNVADLPEAVACLLYTSPSPRD